MRQHTPATSLGLIFAQFRRWPSRLWRWEARFKGVQFQGRCFFVGRPMISLAKGGRIVLGDGVRVVSSLRANPLGCPQPCALRAMASGAELILGPNVGLSATALCAARSVHIGEGTILGAGAIVIDHDFHQPAGQWDWTEDSPANARPVNIGRGVFIGARAIVLKGVTIGDRARIGAGAVVTKDVPAGLMAAGNPARILTPRPQQ
jgi:acetyltransferase-like isoleucine patch superfamily enzyme